MVKKVDYREKRYNMKKLKDLIKQHFDLSQQAKKEKNDLKYYYHLFLSQHYLEELRQLKKEGVKNEY